MSVDTMTRIDMDNLPLGQGLDEVSQASGNLIELLNSIQSSVLENHPELASEQRDSIRSLDMGGPGGWGGC